MQRLIENLGAAFCSSKNQSGVLLLESGKMDKEKFWVSGYADLEKRTQFDRDTKFQIGSVTKQFTALTLLYALHKENGNIEAALKKPVKYFLPDLGRPWNGQVSLHHLLNHTSGLEEYVQHESMTEIRSSENSRSELIKLIDEIHFDPNKFMRFNYSNTNYYILGLVLEKLAGTSAGQFMREEIFEKIGMLDSLLPDESSIDKMIERKLIRKMSKGHVIDMFSEKLNMEEVFEYEKHEISFTAGALISTAADLLKWNKEIFREHRHIPKILTDLMLNKDATVSRDDKGVEWYGYGLTGNEAGNYGLYKISHDGSIPGFESRCAYYPIFDLNIIHLMNGNASPVPQTSMEEIISKGFNAVATFEKLNVFFH